MTASQQPWISIQADVAAPDDVAVETVRLLVIDRDEVAGARLAADLRSLGHIVSTLSPIEEVPRWLEQRSADLLVLVGSTSEVALEGARFLRAMTELPLVVIGPNAASENRVGAFERGAADYVVPPIVPLELDQRIRALVRRERLQRRSDELLGPEGLAMYVRSHEAYVGGERLALTPKEFAVLQVLLEHRGEVVEPDVISQAVWGHQTFGSRNFVEAHISRLRRKLSRAGTSRAIKTVRGIGYVIR